MKEKAEAYPALACAFQSVRRFPTRRHGDDAHHCLRRWPEALLPTAIRGPTSCGAEISQSPRTTLAEAYASAGYAREEHRQEHPDHLSDAKEVRLDVITCCSKTVTPCCLQRWAERPRPESIARH
jgi:hypothetical protein